MNETIFAPHSGPPGPTPAERDILLGNGERCRLSRREAELFAYLTQKAGTPVSREEILAHVWQLNPKATLTRTIDMHVSMLRRKLGQGTARLGRLRTVHGQGYMLQV